MTARLHGGRRTSIRPLTLQGSSRGIGGTEAKRRFLVVTLDAAGNWPPELVLIRALAQRGHEVRVICGAQHAPQIAAAGAEYVAYRHAPERDSSVRPDNQRESEMVRVMRDVFMNPAYGDELLAAVDREAPDVLLVDQMLMTAAAAAESTRLPTAILWHTVYRASAHRWRSMPAPVLEPLNVVRQKLGLARLAIGSAMIDGARAVLAFTYETFDTAPEDAPKHLHYVGPLACMPQPLPPYSLPWPQDDDRPLILVSYSTSFQDQVQTLQRVSDAVAGLPVRVLLTLGAAIGANELQLSDNVVAAAFVPHAAVLPHASLVVTHAGHGTVMAATTAGVPMVCTPMGRDQHDVSACVERLGLGRVVSMTASSEELRDTIAAVLGDRALRERSRRFAASVDVAAGLGRAVEVLENLSVR